MDDLPLQVKLVDGCRYKVLQRPAASKQRENAETREMRKNPMGEECLLPNDRKVGGLNPAAE